jgi:hypothetical protein
VPASSQSPPPAAVAVVDSRREFDPASGSVIAKTILSCPLASGGSQSLRCSGLP